MKEQKMSLGPLQINNKWSLFLDRDGVINKKIDGDYIRSWQQFQWIDNVKESLEIFASVFGKIIVVTNQQGIGKKLMNENDLLAIHDTMLEEIKKSGGRIDMIYYSPHLEEEHSTFRKPRIGMALQAKKEHPEIDFSKSIMVGDSFHDMEFGKRAGMKTVFISQAKEIEDPTKLIDFIYPSLYDFAVAVQSQIT